MVRLVATLKHLLTHTDTQGNLPGEYTPKRPAMKIITGIFLLLFSSSMSVSPARAEQYNLGDMLCSELTVVELEDPNRVKEIMAWFDGYFGANGNDLIYDVEGDDAHKEKILAYCKEHPLSYVMQAASKYFH